MENKTIHEVSWKEYRKIILISSALQGLCVNNPKGYENGYDADVAFNAVRIANSVIKLLEKEKDDQA